MRWDYCCWLFSASSASATVPGPLRELQRVRDRQRRVAVVDPTLSKGSSLSFCSEECSDRSDGIGVTRITDDAQDGGLSVLDHGPGDK
jgi:hypothetical protein